MSHLWGSINDCRHSQLMGEKWEAAHNHRVSFMVYSPYLTGMLADYLSLALSKIYLKISSQLFNLVKWETFSSVVYSLPLADDDRVIFNQLDNHPFNIYTYIVSIFLLFLLLCVLHVKDRFGNDHVGASYEEGKNFLWWVRGYLVSWYKWV